MGSSAELAEDLSLKVKTQDLSADEFLTTKELMRLLKIKHRKTIYRLIDEGMPHIMVGRHYRFIKQEVVSYLKESSGNGKKRGA